LSKPLPRPPRHLHVFGVSLLLIVAALAFFLFGVKLEATVAATGIVESPRTLTIRAPRAGIIESASSPARLEPNADAPLDGGADIATIRPSDDGSPIRVQLGKDAPYWLLLQVHFADGQRIQEGDSIVTVQPLASGDETRFPVRLEIDERQFGSVEVGQDVRIYSNMYHHRTHGVAKGTIERLEPLGSEGPNGSRVFFAWARVTDSPFPLKLGSSARAEIVTGKKPTFQIILEH
jgi:hypothetical protein